MIEHEITRAYRELKEGEQEKREANEKISVARNFLKDHIPTGTSIVGIFHAVHHKPMVSYAAVMDTLISEMIPRGSRVRAWEIVSRYTHNESVHSFNMGGE